MVLLSIFFTRIRSTEGSSADCSLFIFVAPCACSSSAVKNITSNLSVEDLSTLTLHTSLGCISLQNTTRTALCYATNTINVKTFLIFDINHQQNTRRSDQIETIKTIMQTTRPRITRKVLPMAQVAIFKNIRSSAKRFRL